MGIEPPQGVSIAAIEEVYRARYPRFLRLAVSLLGDVDRGRDAVQETFARAIRSRNDFRGGSLDGWLWRTLVNFCLNEKRHVEEPLLVFPESESSTAPSDWLEVRSLIAALPERQRLVLFLRYYADLTQEQIADALAIERGTVAASLHSAQKKIREAIQEVTQ